MCLLVSRLMHLVQKGWGSGGEAPQRLTYPKEHELRVRVKGGREMWVETENRARAEGKNADDK